MLTILQVKPDGTMSYLHLKVVELVGYFAAPRGTERNFKRAVSMFRDLVKFLFEKCLLFHAEVVIAEAF